jgi:hypothetical protein
LKSAFSAAWTPDATKFRIKAHYTQLRGGKERRRRCGNSHQQTVINFRQAMLCNAERLKSRPKAAFACDKIANDFCEKTS